MSKNMTPKVVNNQGLKQTYFWVNFLLKNVIGNELSSPKMIKMNLKKS